MNTSERLNSLPRVAGAALILWVSGCATEGLDAYFRDVDPRTNVYSAPNPPRIEKVAMMPFKAPTELIGASVSDMFVTEFLRIGRFHLVERSQMANVLNETELALAGLSDSKAAEVGNMLGADAVVIGTVDEYGLVAKGGRTIPVVGISVRMIDCRTGRVLCSADLARHGFGNVSLGEQARVVVHKITAGLYQKWRLQRVPPPVPAGTTSPRSGQTAPPAAGGAGTGLSAAPSLAPATPEGFAVSDRGLRRVTVTWQVPPDAADIRYRIERSDSRDGRFLAVGEVAAARGEFVDRGNLSPLKDSTAYYYRMVAVSPGGLESQQTPVLESMTAPPPAPAAGLEAESGLVRVVPLRWRASQDPGVAGYRVLRSESADGPFAEVESVRGRDATTFCDGGREPGRLRDGTTYFYRLRVENEVGAVSEDSSAVKAVTRPAPPVVTGLKVESARPREVPLTWEASPDVKVSGYVVARAEGERGGFQEVQTVRNRDRTAWMDRGGARASAELGRLKDGTLYRYCVAAVNIGATRSEWCEAVNATTKAAPRPPAEVVAGIGALRRVRVQWRPNAEADIREYVVEGRPKGGWRFRAMARVKASETAMMSVEQEGLEDGASYVYRVKAIDGDRLESGWSEPVEGLTKALPGAPQGLTAIWEGDMARLVWKPPAQPDIKQYRLWRKGMLGLSATPLGTVEVPEFALHASSVGSKLVLQISAVDADGLEGPRSEAVEIRTPAAAWRQ